MIKQNSHQGAPCRAGCDRPLTLIPVQCCICDRDDAAPLAVGEDFEYRTSPDTFLVVRCNHCGLVYHNPRPSVSELSRIYPPDYHAYEFSEDRYGLIYQVRRKLEAKRVLAACQGLREDARMIDVGCGDGFHLSLLKDFGQSTWQLEGIDPSLQAVHAATSRGLTVHHGTVQELDLPPASYDLALMIATLEHVDDPVGVLRAVRSLLKPGGKVVIVTDNTDTPHFQMFKSRHWGGYHYPRHWHLFNPHNIHALAQKAELEVDALTTIVSPVNWVYSIHNLLVDWQAPPGLINLFTLNSTLSLGIFTMLDTVYQWFGQGTLMRIVLKRSI